MKKSTWTKTANKNYWAGTALFDLVMLLCTVEAIRGPIPMPNTQAFADKHYKKNHD